MAIDEENYVVKENIRVTRLLLFADWPEKNFSGQSEVGNSNVSRTGKCPGARLDLTVNFHHGHFIDPTNCPWVSEDDL